MSIEHRTDFFFFIIHNDISMIELWGLWVHHALCTHDKLVTQLQTVSVPICYKLIVVQSKIKTTEKTLLPFRFRKCLFYCYLIAFQNDPVKIRDNLCIALIQ